MTGTQQAQHHLNVYVFLMTSALISFCHYFLVPLSQEFPLCCETMMTVTFTSENPENEQINPSLHPCRPVTAARRHPATCSKISRQTPGCAWRKTLTPGYQGMASVPRQSHCRW